MNAEGPCSAKGGKRCLGTMEPAPGGAREEVKGAAAAWAGAEE